MRKGSSGMTIIKLTDFIIKQRFHVAVPPLSNRSQMTSKCVEKRKLEVAHEAKAKCV